MDELPFEVGEKVLYDPNADAFSCEYMELWEVVAVYEDCVELRNEAGDTAFYYGDG